MNLGAYGLPREYLIRVVNQTSTHLQALAGKRIVVLGGTGFIGSWVVASLITAIEQGISLEVVVVSRTPQDGFGINQKNLFFFSHDLSVDMPTKFLDADCLLIAATSSASGSEDQLRRVSSAEQISKGLNKHFGQAKKYPSSIVHLSSGAIYRDYAKTSRPIGESNAVSDSSDNPYVMSKVILEKTLNKLQLENSELRISNPRLFAFYGPKLPTTAHFAIGNFLESAIRRQPITINGNPATSRSYLHVADLAVAIIKLMANPISASLNLGSEKAVSISCLAQTFVDLFDVPGINSNTSITEASFYSPITTRAQHYLGELETIEFHQGLVDWLEWSKQAHA